MYTIMKKSPVVHFEMPYKNVKRVSKFYSGVFGWDMTYMGTKMDHYVVAHTALTDKKMMNKVPGTINGGFYLNTKSDNPSPSFVISVENLEKAMLLIKKAGGKILGKPQEIPGIGLWASFKDPEGNRVSILQASN